MNSLKAKENESTSKRKETKKYYLVDEGETDQRSVKNGLTDASAVPETAVKARMPGKR